MHLSVLGISSEFLDVYSIGKNGNFPLKLTKKLVSNLRVPDNNVEKVLEFIHSVAPSLSKNGPEDKFNKLMQVLVLSALDEGFRSPVLQSCYSRCIGVLLNAIPESQWNENRVWALCQMLHRDGTEHFHNQAVVCCSLLTLSPHAIEIAKALAFATLNHLLATELKTKPLDSIANTSIFALLKYYEPVNELNCYVLYIIIMLVDFCLSRAYVEDNLNLENLSYMVSWLSNLGGRISTAIDSIDTTVMKELISRCLSDWRIMKVDRTYVELTYGDQPASLSSDIKQ
ncbi:uncharacterized protein LOC117282010 [Cryptotermes secundus]|uniref:uncharacterized protein LOC117282010 n=1 Tax=Cryptotermes secundus TaxID=105785 RepID=UPI001454DBF3|nr:uncharacterized protein LOC117282010 [Cryptotermes secundus]